MMRAGRSGVAGGEAVVSGFESTGGSPGRRLVGGASEITEYINVEGVTCRTRRAARRNGVRQGWTGALARGGPCALRAGRGRSRLAPPGPRTREPVRATG